MNGFRIDRHALALAMLIFGFSQGANAFHSGGTAECTGCHSMHSANASSSLLLKGSDQSSTCLNCHQDSTDLVPNSFHVSTAPASMPAGVPPLQRTPGGDFGWLKKNYTYTINGTTNTEDGSRHGHNIVAADFGYVVDPSHTTAPGGGTFPSAQLGCTSCHDPHGKFRRLSDGTVATTGAPIIDSGSYDTSPTPQSGQAVGVYRLLAGLGYSKGGVTFNGVPLAVAPASYNRAESSTQTRVAYGHATGSGRDTWARWCTTCHTQMLSQGHAVDKQLDSQMINNYANYKKSGDMTGTLANSYLSLVPFIENSFDYPTLKTHAKIDDSALSGPGNSDLVSCITCHRAHATAWENMLRWDDKASFLVYNSVWPGTDTTPDVPDYARGRTSAETHAGYYDRPVSVFASYQRSLCNKCHAQD
jgi:predicted CXXCH cytochrome family protein